MAHEAAKAQNDQVQNNNNDVDNTVAMLFLIYCLHHQMGCSLLSVGRRSLLLVHLSGS